MRIGKDLRHSSSKFPYQKEQQAPGQTRRYSNRKCLGNILTEKNNDKNYFNRKCVLHKLVAVHYFKSYRSLRKAIFRQFSDVLASIEKDGIIT